MVDLNSLPFDDEQEKGTGATSFASAQDIANLPFDDAAGVSDSLARQEKQATAKPTNAEKLSRWRDLYAPKGIAEYPFEMGEAKGPTTDQIRAMYEEPKQEPAAPKADPYGMEGEYSSLESPNLPQDLHLAMTEAAQKGFKTAVPSAVSMAAKTLSKLPGYADPYSGIAIENSPEAWKEISDAADKKMGDPKHRLTDFTEKGYISRNTHSGIGSMGPQIAAMPFWLGGKAVGMTGTGLFYGIPAYQDFYDEAIKSGVPEKKAGVLAFANGVAQGGIESVGTLYEMTLVGLGKGPEEIAKQWAKDGAKGAIRRLAGMYAAELSEEEIQNITETGLRKSTGKMAAPSWTQTVTDPILSTAIGVMPFVALSGGVKAVAKTPPVSSMSPKARTVEIDKLAGEFRGDQPAPADEPSARDAVRAELDKMPLDAVLSSRQQAVDNGFDPSVFDEVIAAKTGPVVGNLAPQDNIRSPESLRALNEQLAKQEKAGTLAQVLEARRQQQEALLKPMPSGIVGPNLGDAWNKPVEGGLGPAAESAQVFIADINKMDADRRSPKGREGLKADLAQQQSEKPPTEADEIAIEKEREEYFPQWVYDHKQELEALRDEPKSENAKNAENILSFIRKAGGYNADDVKKQWGAQFLDVKGDQKANGFFGQRLIVSDGGKSIDQMGEALAEAGLIPVDENEKWDNNEQFKLVMDATSGMGETGEQETYHGLQIAAQKALSGKALSESENSSLRNAVSEISAKNEDRIMSLLGLHDPVNGLTFDEAMAQADKIDAEYHKVKISREGKKDLIARIVALHDHAEKLWNERQNTPPGEAAAPESHDIAPEAAALPAEPEAGKIEPETPALAPVEVQAERRLPVNAERRNALLKMSSEEKDYALLHEERGTGLGSRFAVNEAPDLPVKIYMDLDLLKSVNERYGHDAGSVLIQHWANAILAVKGAGHPGHMARIGGDEVLLQAHTEEQANEEIARIDKWLSENPLIYEGQTFPVRYSYGIGSTESEADARQQANKAARKANGSLAERGDQAALGVPDGPESNVVHGGGQDVLREGAQAPAEPAPAEDADRAPGLRGNEGAPAKDAGQPAGRVARTYTRKELEGKKLPELIELYNQTGQIAFHYPRKKEVTFNGGPPKKAADARKRIVEFLTKAASPKIGTGSNLANAEKEIRFSVAKTNHGKSNAPILQASIDRKQDDGVNFSAFNRNEPATFPKYVLNKMNQFLKKAGYDMRGTEDIRRALRQSKKRGAYLLDTTEDWSNAYNRAVGSQEKFQETVKEKRESRIDWKRIEELGKTFDLREAGYIAPDGSLIDLSGKREGGTPGNRAYDHREAGGTVGMQEIMAYGYIRMDLNSGNIDISKAPTSKQITVIKRIIQHHNGEVIVDLGNGLGDFRGDYYSKPSQSFSNQYNKGDNFRKIISDIEGFFSGEKQYKSPMANFFSIAENKHGNSSAPILQASIDRKQGNWATRTVVVQKQSELPEKVLTRLARQGGGTVEAAYDGNTIYVVADNVSPARGMLLAGTHEAVHAGIKGVLGNNYKQTMADIRKALNLGDISDIATEEHIAELSENDNPRARSLWRRIIDAVRLFMLRKGIRLTINNNDVAEIIRQSIAYAKKGKQKTATDSIREFAVDAAMSLKQAAKKITDNPNFVKWFGDSKVVDENGEPLVVYHATDKDFNAFSHAFTRGQIGFHFGTKSQAENLTAEADKLLSVYIAIKNPIRLEDMGGWQGRGVVEMVNEVAGTKLHLSASDSDIREALKGIGYDGVVYENKFEGDGDSYIAFSPTQIKSIYNQGTFDGSNPNISMSARIYAASIYSKLYEAAQNPQMPTKAQSIINWLRGKAGVKPTEIAEMGVEKWVKENQKDGRIDPQAFRDYLAENSIVVEEKRLGDSPTIRYRPLGKGRFLLTHINLEDVTSKNWEFDSKQEMKEWAKEWRSAQNPEDRTSTTTQYSKWQHPGGKDYVEVKLTLPVPKGNLVSLAKKANTNGNIEDIRAWEKEKQKLQSAQFTGPHFTGTPNILAWFRGNWRTDADGRKMFFIEEVQSDWGQKGKKEGWQANNADLPTGYVTRYRKSDDKIVLFKGDENIGAFKDRDSAVEWLNKQGVPQMPFKENWHELALKKAIHFAISESADSRLNDVMEPQSVRELADNFFGRVTSSMMPLKASDGGMLTLAKNDKIARAIVGGVPVDVMNMLGARDSSPQEILGKLPMLLEPIPSETRGRIGLELLNSMREVGADLRAKLSDAFEMGKDIELLPTLRASSLVARDCVGVASPESIFYLSPLSLKSGDTATPLGAKGFVSSDLDGVASKRLPANGTDFLNTSISTLRGTKLGGQSTRLNPESNPTSLANFLDWHNGIISKYAGKSKVNYEVPVEVIGFTTGEQQVARYDLSKHISEVKAEKDYDRGYKISFKTKQGDKHTIQETVPADKLPDHVGKELANKIVNDVTRSGVGNGKTYSGLDLKVGGEGMHSFYGEKLPGFLNKYLKQWGSSVTPTVEDSLESVHHADGTWGVYVTQGKDNYTTGHKTEELAKTVHAFPVTPAMKEDVLYKGQTMFSLNKGDINKERSNRLTDASRSSTFIPSIGMVRARNIGRGRIELSVKSGDGDIVVTFGPTGEGNVSSYLEKIGDAKKGTGTATRLFLEGLKRFKESRLGYESDNILSGESHALHKRLQNAGIPFKYDDGQYLLTAKQLRDIDFDTLIKKTIDDAKKQYEKGISERPAIKVGEPDTYYAANSPKSKYNPQQTSLLDAIDKAQPISSASARVRPVDSPSYSAPVYTPRGVEYLGRGIDIKAATALRQKLRREGRAVLIGQKVNGPQHLGAIGQIFRNPRFESLYIVFIKDGKIVDYTGVTSRLPGEVKASFIDNDGNPKSIIERTRQKLQSLGADGYYIMHNHPSGNPTPSKADIDLTAFFHDSVHGFKGHVVINSGRFSVIAKNGSEYNTTEHSLPDPDALISRAIDHDALGEIVENGYMLAEVGKTLQASPGKVTVILTDQNNYIRAIMNVMADRIDTVEKANALIKKHIRMNGAGRAFAIYHEGMTALNSTPGFTDVMNFFHRGPFTDIVYSTFPDESLAERVGYSGGDGGELDKSGYAQLVAEPAYHGTPHVWQPEPGFPHGRPRLDKIGTGEGAAAYGWGIYLAEEGEVGQRYKESLTRNQNISLNDIMDTVLVDGDKLSLKYDIESDKYFVEMIASERKNEALQYGENRLKRWKELSNDKDYPFKDYAVDKIRAWENLLPKIKEGRVSSNYKGSLYKLDIPDDVIPQLLDWDKPLSEQSEYVKKALLPQAAKMLDNDYHVIAMGARKNPGKAADEELERLEKMTPEQYLNGSANSDGEYLYRMLAHDLGSPKAASEYLASLGIPGNKYLDQGSRGVSPLKVNKIGEKWWVQDSKDGKMHSFETREEAETFADKTITRNFVIWHQPTLDRIALLERNGEKLDAIREEQEATAAPGKEYVKLIDVIGHNFKTSQPVSVEVLHGTDKIFGDFSTRNKSNTKAASAKEAFFFSDSPEIADSYIAYPEKLLSEIASRTIASKGEDHIKAIDQKLGSLIDEFEKDFDTQSEWKGKNLEKYLTYIYGSDTQQKRWEKLADQEVGTEDASFGWHPFIDLTNGHDAIVNLINKNPDAEARLKAIKNLDRQIKDFSYWQKKWIDSERKMSKSFVDDFVEGDSELHPNVQKNIINFQNPFVYDFKNKDYREETYYDLIQQAKQNGHDGCIFLNTKDPYTGTVFAVFNSDQIKNAFERPNVDALRVEQERAPYSDNSQYRAVLDLLKKGKPPVDYTESKEEADLYNDILRLRDQLGYKTKPKKFREIIDEMLVGPASVGKSLDMSEAEALKIKMQAAERAAKKAMAAGKKEGELQAKEKLLDLRRRQKLRENTAKALKKMIADIKGLDLEHMDKTHADAIRVIIAGIDFTKMTPRHRLSLEKTKKFFEEHAHEVELPDGVKEKLERLEKIPVRDLSLEDFTTLYQAIMHYAHLAKLKDRIRVGRHIRQAKEVLMEALAEMAPAGKPVDPYLENIDLSDAQSKGSLKRFAKSVKNVFGISQEHFDLVVESLAGPNSTMDKVLNQNIHEGVQAQDKYTQETWDNFRSDFEAQGVKLPKDISKWLTETVTTGRIKLTRDRRMSLYRHALNPDNRTAILRGGFGDKFSDQKNATKKITEEELTAIIESLTPEEKAFAGAPVDKLFERQYQLLNEVFRQKNGYDLPRPEGPYYPKEVMPIGRSPLEKEAEDALTAFKNKWLRIGISKGMLKKRLGSRAQLYLNPLTYDLRTSVERAAAYIGLEMPLSNASKLLYNPKFKAQMQDRFGEETWRHIEQGIRDIAGEFKNTTDADGFFMSLRKNIPVAFLGLNVFSMAKQSLAYPLYWAYVKPRYLLQGLVEYTMHPVDIQNRHKLHSVEYRQRVDVGYERDIANVYRANTLGHRLGGSRSLRERSMGGMVWVDKQVVTPCMQGAILQVLDELKKGHLSREVATALNMKDSDIAGLTAQDKIRLAYKYADYATERTQSMREPMFRSAMSRGTALEQIFTMFASDTNAMLNMMRRAWRDARRTNDAAAWTKLGKAYFLIFVVNSLAAAGIDELRDLAFGRKGTTFAGKVARNVTSLWYGVRDVMNAAISTIESGRQSGVTFTPVESAVTALSATIGYAATGKWGKSLDNAAMLISMLRGVPYFPFRPAIKAVLGAGEKEEKKSKFGKF